MRRKLLASLLAIVMVISLVPATVLAADFADTNGHWGEAAIDRWADVGILNGKGEGNFDPDGSMTRAEFAQMLATMMGYTARVPNNFTDVPAGAWYEDAMLKLVAAGVLSGNGDGTATPNDPITREQAAVLLCRAFNLEPSRNASLNYQDSGSISSWARDAMAALAERGMMSGVGDNTAAPQLNINRASVATLADNMIAEYVTESKTITGRVDGIILVAGGASVNLDNATVSEPVIIAPKASGVSVNLTGNTTADDIVIEANSARVSVGANASASSVKAESNSASVSVAGTVSSVDVTGSNGKVTVTGSVGTVSTEATGTSITVSGTVSNVDIGANAGRASVTASAGGKIDSVTTDASNVTVSGSGTVGSVTATGGSVDVTTKGTEVSNKGASDVTASGSTVSSGSTATSSGSGSSSSGGSSDDNDDSSSNSSGNSGNTGDTDPSGPSQGGQLTDPTAWPGLNSGEIVKNSASGNDIVVTVPSYANKTAYDVNVSGNIPALYAPTGSSGLPAYWVGVDFETPSGWRIIEAVRDGDEPIYGGTTDGSGDETAISPDPGIAGTFDMWFDLANGVQQVLTVKYRSDADNTKTETVTFTVDMREVTTFPLDEIKTGTKQLQKGSSESIEAGNAIITSEGLTKKTATEYECTVKPTAKLTTADLSGKVTPAEGNSNDWVGVRVAIPKDWHISAATKNGEPLKTGSDDNVTENDYRTGGGSNGNYVIDMYFQLPVANGASNEDEPWMELTFMEGAAGAESLTTNGKTVTIKFTIDLSGVTAATTVANEPPVVEKAPVVDDTTAAAEDTTAAAEDTTPAVEDTTAEDTDN